MNRNVVYIITGVLAIAIVILIYELYQERQETGIEIHMGESEISIEGR